MDWKKRSQRLWTAEQDGRAFRIERLGSASANGGTVVKEMDTLHRPVRQEDSTDVTSAKALAAKWLAEPTPTEPIRNYTRMADTAAIHTFQLKQKL